MKINEIYTQIVKISGKPVSQAELGKALNISRQGINDKLKRNSKVSLDDVKKLEEYFDISLSGVQQAENMLTIKLKQGQRLIVEYEI